MFIVRKSSGMSRASVCGRDHEGTCRGQDLYRVTEVRTSPVVGTLKVPGPLDSLCYCGVLNKQFLKVKELL